MTGPHTEIREAPASVIRRALEVCWDCGQTGGPVRVSAEAGLDALERLEREAAERETALDVLATCDCVYAPHSSGCCSKCGRQGTITAERWLEIVTQANRTVAAEARVREVEAERDKLKDALREIACNAEGWQHGTDGQRGRALTVIATVARAYGGPEAPAAEPRPKIAERRCEQFAPHPSHVWYGSERGMWKCPGTAALPAVDAATPETTT